MITVTDQISSLAQEIQIAETRHKTSFQDSANAFIAGYEDLYREEMEQLCSFLTGDEQLAPITKPAAEKVKAILWANRWTGWELCHLGTVLKLQPARDYAIAVLLYNALHLIDDSIDGHEDYSRLQMSSYYGELVQKQLPEREASGINAMVGIGLLQFGAGRLLKLGYQQTADIFFRLIPRVFTGMFCESLSDPVLKQEEYWKVINWKSVAYQMLLDQSLLWHVEKELRSQLLQNNVLIVETGQLIDDLNDWHPDLAGQNFNINRVKGMDKTALVELILERLLRFQEQIKALPSLLHDVFAFRIAAWIRLLQSLNKSGA